MLLFCDTDCLIQIFLSSQTTLLRWFKTTYDLNAIIMPEVEAELAWHAKFKARFDPDIKKAVGNGVISTFDYLRPELQLSKFLPGPQIATVTRAIIETGRDYSLKVGLGEAYSHAACRHLGMPLLSHDISAIRTLQLHNLATAAPTLRLFDLIVLAYHKGGIDAKHCNVTRQTLYHQSEWLPIAFAHNSFEDGLKNFNLRLYDAASQGGFSAPACQNYSDPLYLSSI